MSRRLGRALPVLALLAIVLAGCAGRGGAAGPAAATPAGPHREVLPNGLRFIHQDERSSGIVAVHLWVGVGVRFERPDELGYSHFMEHMLFKGTDRWGPGYIDRTVEGVGGRSNAVTSYDYTNFHIVVPVDALETAVETLHAMAFRSAFDPQEIAREREVIFEEARIEQDTPRSALVRQLYGLVFEGHPYGRPVLGTRPTMEAATRERLVRYWRHYYTPENMTVVVVGPADRARARAVVARTFGRERRTAFTPPAMPPVAPVRARVSRDVQRPEQQAWLGLAWSAPRSDDPEGFAVDLLANILGGTESSRLVQRLRDRERLVAELKMSYAPLVGGGIVSVRAALEAKDVPRVEAILLEEVARIQAEGVTEDERQLAITKAESDHAFDTETSEGLANAYGLAETTWTLEEELRYIDRLRSVTREQIQAAARRFLDRERYVRLAFLPGKP